MKRKRRDECIEVVQELERQRDAGRYVWHEREVTLSTWANYWLDDYLPLAGRKAKTIDGYRSLFRCHILPALGQTRLRDVTTDQLVHHWAELLRAGVGGHTLSAAHRALRSCLAAAIQVGRIGRNPALGFTPATPEEEEVEPLTLDEAQSILVAARNRRGSARWSVALALGLRQGEALGLQWRDVNLDTGVISVRRSLRRETGRHGCPADQKGQPTCGYGQGGRCPQRTTGGLVAREPKTKKSRRVVALPDGLVIELRTRRAEQAAERLRAGDAWQSTDWVFATELGAPIDPRRDWGEWKALLSSAGVRDARLHDARHTAATMLLAAGVDSRTVMSLMGWTEHRTAQRYTHVVDPMRAEAARRIGAVLYADLEVARPSSGP